MPPNPGEERILTVFADIHYYFTAPTPRPLHHRFDKGSYFYIYYNSTRRTSRLEVANNPGTPEQDAFSGYLDTVQLRWSYKFPTLLTLVVDSIESSSPGGQSPPGRDANEWRLASTDPRDQGRYMYRLHTLDIYFWTLEDARLVVDTTKRLLLPNQLDYLEQQHTPTHHESMSPVVQQLENVAITDPAYRNGQTRNSQNEPTASAHAHQALTTSPPAQASTTATQGSPQASKPAESPMNYQPLAYNPAAPPAPEPIAHREKTPPPLDAGEGTGLAAAAVADQGLASPPPQPYAGVPGPAPTASSPWGQPPAAGQAQFSSPPSTQSFHHTPSVSSTSSRPAAAPMQFAPPPVDPAVQPYTAQQPQQPLQSPGSELYGSVYSHQPQLPVQHLQPQYADYLASRPQPPPGGYSQYSYDQPAQQQAPANQYDVHSQLYRPTEAEAHSHVKPSSGGQKPGKLEEKADRVEKRVNSFLKKLEKRL